MSRPAHRPPLSTLLLSVAVLLASACGDRPTALETTLVHTERSHASHASIDASVDLLEDRLGDLVATGALNPGQRVALVRKLESLERHLAQGRTGPALVILDAFVEQVENFVADGVLTPAEGQRIVASAQAIRNTLAPSSLPIRGATVATAAQHACALDDTGQPWCWGDGSGTPSPVPDAPVLSTLAAGVGVTCGLDATGAAWCWGGNGNGTLGVGDPSLMSSATPLLVDAPAPFVELDVGNRSACGLTAGGEAWCWGGNGEGQLGTSSPEQCLTGAPCASAPVRAAGNLTFHTLDVGLAHTCGAGTDGETYCWGWDLQGADGDGVAGNGGPTPRTVDTSLTLSEVSAGTVHTCALDPAGAGHCWGGNTFGGLGTGSTADADTPSAVAGGHTFRTIETSDANSIFLLTCAIDDTAAAWCWGADAFGALGTDAAVDPDCGDIGLGPVPCSRVPVPVSGGLTWTEIDPNQSYTCGRTTGGDVHCWGRNAVGTLGDGTTTDRSEPTLVVLS